MWKLISIKATNLCAFEELQYKPLQNHATLVFGNNMDNESQNSNGAGKSALIEAIAIAITGETLRKVNMDEIINDSANVAEIEAHLACIGWGVTMTVYRKLSRKNPQEIRVTFCSEGDEEEIKQANVNEYNKYILEQIGLTKDDIFANFILTARKYRSFLSSSDSTKKEIINRFSNGIIVDESIAALHEDIVPAQTKLLEAEKQVSECKGRVSALASEIERVIEESASRSENKKLRIANWKEAIANNHSKIRANNQEIQVLDNKLDKLESLDAKMQSLEKSTKDTKAVVVEIEKLFKELEIVFEYDYETQFTQLNEELDNCKHAVATVEKNKATLAARLDEEQGKLVGLEAMYPHSITTIERRELDVKEQIQSLTQTCQELQQRSKQLGLRRSQIVTEIGALEVQLAGVIQCPKCNHEFVVAGNVDIAVTREQLQTKRTEINGIEDELESTDALYAQRVSEGKAMRAQESEILTERANLTQSLNTAKTYVSRLQADLSSVESRLEHLAAQATKIQNKIATQRTDIFDAVFATIDEHIQAGESAIKALELNNTNCEGAIKSYEESIAEIENASETDVVAKLKESKEKYEKELAGAIQNQEAIAQHLNILKTQEATFVEFKTHLANTKINAISQITNDFLETIGSDIRVVLSGYTMLKSGKVRDKISVSLMRDGVDCGSFEKFSKGEQTRVELANILALHKLTNVNCEEGKGLDLLIFDEILDATDEQGLTNVFKALNDTQITSLVVSHGNIAENYPNRLVINKRNGVSFI